MGRGPSSSRESSLHGFGLLPSLVITSPNAWPLWALGFVSWKDLPPKAFKLHLVSLLSFLFPPSRVSDVQEWRCDPSVGPMQPGKAELALMGLSALFTLIRRLRFSLVLLEG